MKVLLSLLLLIGIAATPLFGGASGSFAGTVVEGPEQSSEWMYVQGHNHSLRRVNVTRATIRYDSSVPQAERKSPLPKPLPAGTQVRVTAEQDESGEWRANNIEILRGSGEENEKKDVEPTTSQT